MGNIGGGMQDQGSLDWDVLLETLYLLTLETRKYQMVLICFLMF